MQPLPLHLKLLFARYPIVTAYLFGSQAANEATPSSDYDFAILLSSKVEPRFYGEHKLKLTAELLKIVKTEFVDVVILNDKRTPILLKFRIIKEGKLIYERSKLQRIAFECDVMLKWYDQKYFEDLWHAIFTKGLAEGKIL